MVETPSLPLNQFETALAAARLADLQKTIRTDDGREFALTPKNFDLRDISDPARLDPHPAAAVTVDEKQALIDYVNRFGEPGTILVADVDAGEVSAKIDYHLPGDGDVVSGARKHAATLKLRPSEEFSRWNDFEGELRPQAEFARFLEENAVDIVDPDSATMIEIARDLEASQGMKFRSKVNLTTGDRTFHYENETRVENNLVIPKKFIIEIPLYAGEEPRALECLFRFSIGGGGLLCGFEWRRVEHLKLAHFREIAYAVAEGTGKPVYLGRLK